ncbi:MAG TPA: ABC transporter permease [Polyangiaceae bacterium]|nr:ABC transporter permease [Polyangiaceae bacterium]
MSLRRRLGSAMEFVGGIAVVLLQALRATLRRSLDVEQLREGLIRLGLHSLPVVFGTALFVGGIMVIQSAPLMTRYGAHSLLGWGAGFGILREIGPILTGLMISGRVGSNNTAELGTLQVTEQINGLRALAIDPADYLVAPRVLSILVTTVVGTLLSMAVALVGAALTGQALLGVHPITFWNGLTGGMLSWGDVAHGMVKAFVFGLVIAGTSTAYGLRAKGGAPGVGRAVNESVVLSAVAIFVTDALISFASRGN